MAHTLTIGKLRGLRQISTEGGIFTMAAEDQRGSMRKMLNPNDPHGVPAAAMTEVKLDIARALIARVGEDCQKHDIPFILECVGYAVEGMKTDSPEYAAMKPEIVIETARMVSGLGVDVYKAEFPADSKYEKDEGKLLDLCKS